MPRHALTDRECQINRHIGTQIRVARAGRGWSLERLADRAGLAPKAVQSYETAARTIPACQLQACAEALGIPAGQLFDGLQEPGATPIDSAPGIKAIRIAERLDRLTTEQKQAVLNVITALEAGTGTPGANGVRSNPVASALTEGLATVAAQMPREFPSGTPRVVGIDRARAAASTGTGGR